MTKFIAGPANSTATRFHVFCLYIAYGRLVGRELLDRRHARDVAEAAERNGLDAVLGVPACWARGGPQRRDRSRRSSGAPSSRWHAPPTCGRIRAAPPRRRMASANSTMPSTNIIGWLRPPAASTRACARRPGRGPSRCASSTSSTVAGSADHWSAARSTSAMVRTIAGNRMRPGQERRGGFLVGGVVDRRQAATPPARPARARSTAGKTSASSGSNSQRRRGGEVAGRARRRAPGRASPAPARWAASCRAGWPGRCVEPSVNVTIECTIDCGCTTTSMRS